MCGRFTYRLTWEEMVRLAVARHGPPMMEYAIGPQKTVGALVANLNHNMMPIDQITQMQR